MLNSVATITPKQQLQLTNKSLAKCGGVVKQFALTTRDGKAVKFLWKRKHFQERCWKRKQLGSIWLFEELEAEAFFIKHGAGMWKQQQTRRRLTLCGVGNGSKLLLPHPS